MVEPSKVNPDRCVRIYAADISNPADWQTLFAWRKDIFPMSLFQYGNAFLPDGQTVTSFLAVSTIAVDSEDMVLSLYEVDNS